MSVVYLQLRKKYVIVMTLLASMLRKRNTLFSIGNEIIWEAVNFVGR
jgi:hypothetical protein